MKNKPVPSWFYRSRRSTALFALGVGMLLAATLVSRAAPAFPLPNPAVHPPGFVVHLAPTGPAVVVPGVGLGPIFYGDGLASPDVHHWELEISNPNPVPFAFNVTFIYPGGAPVLGGLFLPVGGSMYFDLMYADAPPEIGGWAITVASPPAMPLPFTVDMDVLEYPFLAGAPGLGAVIPFGGAAFGAPIGGAPVATFTVGPGAVPEPGTLALFGLGAAALAWRVRRANNS